MTIAAAIRIQQVDFDIAREIAALTAGRTDIGAVVSFSGICRGTEGNAPIAALTLEHYPEMAEAEIKRHADEAISRWPPQALTVIHPGPALLPPQTPVPLRTSSHHPHPPFQPPD